MIINTFCSYCGTKFRLEQPLHCAKCGSITYENPAPVPVLLVPVCSDNDLLWVDGLLAVIRGIPPKIGELALPGGFHVKGETWREAGARELFEETNVVVDPAKISIFEVESTPNDNLLLFATTQPVPLSALDAFQPNKETLGIKVLDDASTDLAFPLHTQAYRKWFSLNQQKLGRWFPNAPTERTSE